MTTVTTSLERSLQNCSLNQSTTRSRRGASGGAGSSGVSCWSSSSESPELTHHNHLMEQRSHRNNRQGAIHFNTSSSDDNSASVDLNSHLSLPYHWEQCLDLKSGELYYINWRTGAKSKEDPRTTATGYNGDYYSEAEDEDEDEDEDESDNYNYNDNDNDEEEVSIVYDSSEGSSTESSSCTSNRDCFRSAKRVSIRRHQTPSQQEQKLSQASVLVVAGCKSCFMYYMVPKHVDECPKCSGQLLHFDANNITSP